MKKKLIRNLLLVVALTALCLAVAITANAFGETMAETGQCGDNVYWDYDSVAKELVISGTGPMWDYEPGESPFIAFEHNREPAKIFFEKVIINEGVTSVGKYAFDDEGVAYVAGEFVGTTIGITSVSLPETVTKIGEGAFRGCYALTEINLPLGLTRIENNTFDRCFYLKNIVIPEGVTEIGEEAFYVCWHLEEIVIPDSVKKIGNNSFRYNASLKKVTLPAGIETISNGVFSQCPSLESIEIPESVVSIGDQAFYHCLNLKNIDLPDRLCSIGQFAFAFCVSLEEITIPEDIESINEGSFYACISLKEIKIPKNVTNIGEAAFAGCLLLKEIVIPENIQYIGEDAFSDCFEMERAVLLNEKTVLDGKRIFCAGEYGVADGVTIDEFIEVIRDYLYMESYSFPGDIETQERILNRLINSTKIHDGYRVLEKLLLHGHTHSTTESYATERNIPFVQLDETYHPDIYFADEWTYDYDNMVRYRECTFTNCDVKIEEPLETTESGDVEIIEPVDPDADFEVEEVTGENFLLVEEKVVNGIEGNVEVLRAFDITFKNKDGVHVQPDGTVKVKLPLDWTKDGIYKVYRVNDDGTLTDMNAYRQGSHMVFETDHFSIYVIVDVSEKSEADEPETPDTPDVPAEPDTSDCSCICHKEGWFFEMLTIVFRFVTKLLGVFPTCDCGIVHY